MTHDINVCIKINTCIYHALNKSALISDHENQYQSNKQNEMKCILKCGRWYHCQVLAKYSHTPCFVNCFRFASMGTEDDVFKDVLYELEEKSDESSLSISSNKSKHKIEDISYSFKSTLLKFLKQIASATGDLSQLTCPAIMLSGKSLVEYSQYWASHPDLLADIPSSSNSFDRMIATTKWFLSTLWGSYASRSFKDGYERKPYNPILGEQFFATWSHPEAGTTTLICEQVSHHPPITAFHIENDSKNVIVNGFNGQKTRFTGTSIKVVQDGQIQLWIPQYEEEIRITYPEVYMRSLFTGSPFLELTGTSFIQSSTGSSTEIHFIPKPWFSGEYHKIRAIINGSKIQNQLQSSNSSLSCTESITNISSDNEECLYLSGKWTESIFASSNPFLDSNWNGNEYKASSAATSSNRTRNIVSSLNKNHNSSYIFHDSQSHSIFSMNERSLNEIQDNDLDTYHVWGQVTAALQQKNYDLATSLKTTIEEEQRDLRKMRSETETTWNPKFFEYVDDNSKSASFTEFPWRFIGKI